MIYQLVMRRNEACAVRIHDENAGTVRNLKRQKKVVDAEFRISCHGDQLSQPPDAVGDGARPYTAISYFGRGLFSNHLCLHAGVYADEWRLGKIARSAGNQNWLWLDDRVLVRCGDSECVLSAGALSLGFFQFLLGVGEAGNYPAGVKLITEWFLSEERSHASGIFNSGASIGAILAPPLLALIVLASGWRTAFVTIGLLGFLWLAGWFAVYRKPHAAISADPAERLPMRTLLRSKFLWQFTLSKVFSDPVWYFYIFWFPQYLKVAHSFSMREIGGDSLDSLLHSYGREPCGRGGIQRVVAYPR